MKLVRFKIVEVKEKSSDEEYSKGFDFKTKYHRTVWDYEILGDDGNTYMACWRSKPLVGIVKGRTVCANVIQMIKNGTGLRIELEPKRYEIKWQTMDRQGVMTPQKFAIEVKKEIERTKKSIEYEQNELARLQSLVK
jgi:hypothetical protein